MEQSLKKFINRFLCGDAYRVLQQLPDESIDCVVTSPPYWALRDYGVKGQLGLEPTFHEYIVKLCGIFDEVKRVLKTTGTCWINLGDTYYSNHSSGSNEGDVAEVTQQLGVIRKRTRSRELPEKSLCQVPSRFAIEMTNRGWVLRNEIIWHKPNGMPAGVKDRFTVNFEKIFFFVKNERYWFDLDAVREPHNEKQIQESLAQARQLGHSGKNSYKEWYFHQRKKKSWVGRNNRSTIGFGAGHGISRSTSIHPLGKAKRCVWSIPTKPFTGKHYAVYPPELIETPVKAGCPKGGIVLDPFIGSGTTALVAKRLSRNFIGIDLNPDYVRMSKTRLADVKPGQVLM